MKPSKNQIAERLKQARLNAGYRSARIFAMKHHIPYITYSQHEAGKRKMNPDVMVAYSKYLNVDAAWLFTGQEGEHLKPEKNISSKNFNFLKKSTLNLNSLPIDAEQFSEIYIEVNQLIKELKASISDKNKIKLCVDIYNAISAGNFNVDSKQQLLNLLIQSIKTLKNKGD